MMMKFSNAILILSFLVCLNVEVTQCTARNMKLLEFQAKIPQKSSVLSEPSSETPKRNGRVFFPIGYGADPTGKNDSSAAIMAALEDAVKLKKGENLIPGISDLGGPVIDLQGESFVIAQPLRFPPNIGNIVMKGGTLRASENFPEDRHLIELWAPDSKKSGLTPSNDDPNKGMKYEDISFTGLLLDSSFRGGGLMVIDSARIRITDCYLLHFATQGITVERGHETFISSTFLGQHPTVGGDKEEREFSGTAIDIASTDNSISDVTVFSSAIGIVLRGRANIIANVHCYNKASSLGGVGILVKSAQNRIINAYLDYNSIVIEDPEQITIMNGFFIGDGNVVLKPVQGKVSGLNIISNVFSANSKTMVPTVSLEGNFTSVDQVAVKDNVASGMSLKATKANLNVHGNGTKWVADFSNMLLFPDMINHLQYSLYVKGANASELPALVATSVANNVVVIESQHPVNGVVSVSVDQHNMPGEGYL